MPHLQNVLLLNQKLGILILCFNCYNKLLQCKFVLFIAIWKLHFVAIRCSWRGVLDTTLCDKVCQWLVTVHWFSPGTPVSSTNKTACHNITEILLKVALDTMNQAKPFCCNWDLNFNTSRNFYVMHFSALNFAVFFSSQLFFMQIRPIIIYIIEIL